MSRPDWKRTERSIAARLGGQRVPVSGRARGDVPDIRHARLAVEVKHRQSLPGWLLDAMAQAVVSAGPEQTPVAVLHQHGNWHAHDLCVLRLSDLETLLTDTNHAVNETNP